MIESLPVNVSGSCWGVLGAVSNSRCDCGLSVIEEDLGDDGRAYDMCTSHRKATTAPMMQARIDQKPVREEGKGCRHACGNCKGGLALRSVGLRIGKASLIVGGR